MGNDISLLIGREVPTVSQALAALVAMEKELASASTYEKIKAHIRLATAYKELLGHIDMVKVQAENTILTGHIRIGEELIRQPVAKGTKGQLRGKLKGAGPSGGARLEPPDSDAPTLKEMGIRKGQSAISRKLAAHPDEVKAVADRLRARGKDATPRAVATEITYGDKKQRRDRRMEAWANRILAVPDRKFGVVVEDFEWDQLTWSERGRDRHASNTYMTSTDAHTAEEIVRRTEERFRCVAADAVLFSWVTIPHLAIGIDVLRLRGFRYSSNYVWGKTGHFGMGFWGRETHEQLLIGVRGKFVVAPESGTQMTSLVMAPEPGTEMDSLVMAPKPDNVHSSKPDLFLEWIKKVYPKIPKIELNRRGPAYPGYSAWGAEAEPAEGNIGGHLAVRHS